VETPTTDDVVLPKKFVCGQGVSSNVVLNIESGSVLPCENVPLSSQGGHFYAQDLQQQQGRFQSGPSPRMRPVRPGFRYLTVEERGGTHGLACTSSGTATMFTCTRVPKGDAEESKTTWPQASTYENMSLCFYEQNYDLTFFYCIVVERDEKHWYRRSDSLDNE
jgi:hypothetical protein